MSPQLFHNDTFANDATTCMFSQYPYYPPDKILNTQKTFSYIFTYFPFCHHLILVLKVVPPLQVHELVCILSSVFFLNNLHTPQFFKNYPLFSNILSLFVSFQLYYKRSLEKCQQAQTIVWQLKKREKQIIRNEKEGRKKRKRNKYIDRYCNLHILPLIRSSSVK